MTELDELLSRLRKLEPLPLPPELQSAVQRRAARVLQRPLRPAPLASLAVLGTIALYLSWALSFTASLYP